MDTTPTMLLPVQLSPEGIACARRELDQTETIVGSARIDGGQMVTVPPGGTSQQPDVVTIHEHACTVPQSRTPRLLELFARKDNLLTPEEIGIELANGQPLTKAQGRAFVRNLSKMQGHLIGQGVITREVLVKDFTRYDQEDAGRYGLTDQDRKTLRAHLGI